jgi:ATP-dependent DNA helicase RecQ
LENTAPQTQSYESLLRSAFSLESFRRGQREIISSVLMGKDVLAVLPTGGGKSLCFQFPAFYREQLVIVISPLIALMKDQVSSLTRQGLRAGSLHSGQTEGEKREVFRQMQEAGPFVLYLSPERAQKEGFHQWIKQRSIALFAIDEAHCVSQWGHDFREEYAQLNILKTLRPDVPILALTASATPTVLNDVSRRLGLVKPDLHVHGFYRPNLYYQVEACADEDEKMAYLQQALRQTPEGRVIVYCGTRKITEAVAGALQRDFEKVDYYHAGLSPNQRTDAQESYERGDVRILVATNAFGMGIDHPDVRMVVHFQMPANIDSLYQEMGRAGRDGKESTCLMLYSKKDKGLQSFFIQESTAPAEIKRSRWNTLEALINYAEGGECRHAEILTYYRDSQRLQRCGHCDSCVPSSSRKIAQPPPGMMVNAVVRVRKKSKSAKSGPPEDQLTGLDEQRFQDLRDWRKAKATELDVPAFVVFSDKTLKHLALANPQTLEELRRIYGISEAKVERFGPEILSRLSTGF